MDTVEILKAARAKIAKPENWRKGGYAADAHGRTCSFDDPEAVCFCAEGALFSAVRDDSRLNNAYELVRAALPTKVTFLPAFNDAETTAHADILALFDRAIAAAEAQS